MKGKIFKILSLILLLVCGTTLFSQKYFASADAPEEGIIEKNVRTADEFVEVLSDSYNNNNIEINLLNDIDFDGINLSSLYENDNLFCGTLNGNGYTISNITFTSGTNNYGLIPNAKGATIKNLRVAGDVEFDIDSENTNDIHAGILFGYGEKVNVENCELYNITVSTSQDEETGDTTQVEDKKSVKLDVYSDLYFGGIVGKLKGNSNIYTANIKNVVSYYNIELDMKKYSNLYVGGLIGYFEQGYILNCLSFGDITVNNTISSVTEKSQHLGGIVGYALGTNAKILNTCYGGNIKQTDNSTNLNVSKGAIVGTVPSIGAPSQYNMNYGYWTKDLNAFGSGLSSSSQYLAKVELLNEKFLTEGNHFDPSNEEWDFDRVWQQISAKLRLQIFQTYDLTFSTVLDNVTQKLKSASFMVDEVELAENTISVKYGKTVSIKLTIKDDACGYYELSSVLLNSQALPLSINFNDYAVTNSDGAVCAYIIPIEVTDLTDGTYSFTMKTITFNCLVKVSDEAREKAQGGVKRVEASTTTYSMPLPFSIQTPTIKIVAVGNGIYSFDFWELYYYDENEELQEVTNFTLSDNPQLVINFGTGNFNREFVLVAYFTDEDAVNVLFNTIDNKKIKNIIINNEEYAANKNIQLPPKATVALEIITNDKFVMTYQKFMSDFQQQYGENTIMMTNDPIKDEKTGQTAYKFSINMRKLENVENNTLQFNIVATDAESGNRVDMIWIYLAVGAGVIIIAGVVVLVIIKKRGGGKGSGKKAVKATSSKTDSSSYSDYYI